MDRITAHTRSIFPITWDGLSNDDRVGDSVLALRVEAATQFILGAVPTEVEEAALDALVIDYVAKYAALQIIPAGIDFWMVQAETLTTTGTSEVLSYTSRIAALRELRKDLVGDLTRIEPLVTPLIPNLFARSSGSRPLISTLDQELLTPDPQDFGPIYAPPEAA